MEPDDTEAISGSRPLTPLEVLKRPFPTKLFDDALNGHVHSRREFPPAVTRCILPIDGEDSPTTFLSHADELDVFHHRRSSSKASTTPPYQPLRRTGKSPNLKKEAVPVGKKTVRFFVGHLPTGTVPSITITSAPDQETPILPPESETDRSLLSVNKKLHGTTLSKRNAERREERSLVVQKRAVRIYEMELGRNGGDENKAKAKAEKWLNCVETRMFVAGWVKEGIDPISKQKGKWRDVDETRENGR
jgi:hypothetical protein